MKHILLCIILSLSALQVWAAERDTVYLTGDIQHDGLFATVPISGAAKESWAPVNHRSNTYLTLGIRREYTITNIVDYHGYEGSIRYELMPWAMPGYDASFDGHGLAHFHAGWNFGWGKVTIGDVYGQFGSGLILHLYEDRPLGIDNALRGGKIEAKLYKGIHTTIIGGKQRRYWSSLDDGAWGFHYERDAVLGADLKLTLSDWIQPMRAAGANLTIGASWVSKYEARDSTLVPIDGQMYYRIEPRWVGATDVRVGFQMHGWQALIEYAYKANDPSTVNQFDYTSGNAILASLSYSRKGLSVLLQGKRNKNMAFRSARGLAPESNCGYINHLPAFTRRHTYMLPSIYPWATQPLGEWGVQAEVRYTAPRKSALGGKYGTTFILNASHLRGLDNRHYYTDVHLELNKKIDKQWYIAAMLMYQACDLTVLQGHGDMVHAGIGVMDVKYAITNDIHLRGELQYLYTAQDKGQWTAALLELALYKHWMISGQWMYNIGGTTSATNEHFYTAGVTYTIGAHQLMLSYTKTKDGYNCSGGVCRWVPKQEGVSMSYTFNW